MLKAPLIRILEQLDVEIISKTPNGKNGIMCRCPLAEWTHDKGRDRNPGFFAYVDERHVSGFYCFTCKTKGRIAKLARLLAYHRGENYNDIIIDADLQESPDSYGSFDDEEDVIEMPKALDVSVWGNMFPLAWEDKRCREYIAKRGITREISELLGLKYDPEEKRVLFPVMDRKRDLFGFTARTILEPHEFPKLRSGKQYARHRDYSFDKEFFILGEELIQPGKPLFLVEGKFAYAHLVAIGAREICNPVASNGSSLSPYQAERLIDYDLPVFLCYDNDKAGDIGLFGPQYPANHEKAGQHLGGGAVDKLRKHVPTFVALFPDDVEDVDDFELEDVRNILTQDHEAQ